MRKFSCKSDKNIFIIEIGEFKSNEPEEDPGHMKCNLTMLCFNDAFESRSRNCDLC